ncbi:MAG: hypothetical protein O7J95_21250 [Planctomycetota bacterium]|nr:hypothetical protein [Planctomycetota bacterium]
MKILTTSCLAGSLLCVGVSWAFWNYAGSAPPPLASPPDRALVVELEQRLAALEADHAALAGRVGELEARIMAVADPSRTAVASDVESATDPDEPPAEEPAPDPAIAGEQDEVAAAEEEALEREAVFEDALAVIADPGVHRSKKQKAWNELRQTGLLDDAIAAIEENARDNPRDAHIQAELGHAYIQKIFTVNDLEKMKWSTKANAQYDKALAVDGHHWEARFSKAVNYSFIPPVFGMQSKAIEQFEILVKQQESQSPRDDFAQSYLYLGNLYSSQGKTERAQQVWRRGSELFPDAKDLARRVKPQPEE